MASKKSITDYKSQRKIYKILALKIRNDSGIMQALENQQSISGIPPSTYAQAALREKLIRDGYLIAESQTSEE